MLVDEVISRITAKVPEFDKRIQGALELAALVKEKCLPNETPFAFVIPLGLSGGQGETVTGMFRQSVDDTVAVVILLDAADDVAGEKSLPSLTDLIDKTINGVCGWAPADEIGGFHLVRGVLLSLDAGTVIYQLDFKIQDQLRIMT